MSRDMRFPTMWFVRPAKPQISLRIHAVWSKPLLVACMFYECWATDWTTFEDSKLMTRLYRLVWVYTCQNTILFEITCHGSNESGVCYCTLRVYNFVFSSSGCSLNRGGRTDSGRSLRYFAILLSSSTVFIFAVTFGNLSNTPFNIKNSMTA